MADRPQHDTDELLPYLDAGWQLMPLHSHDYFDEHKGKRRERGKSPLHPNWTRRPYASADQAAHMRAGGNVGVRLRAADLVVDVDPRNFVEGDDPLARLCADCGVDPDACPTVETGSGGLHLYMVKPADVSVRDSLPDYQGVEFKTLGRQVVAAGSVHPSTRRTYRWDFLRPALKAAPQAPARLLNLARRPARPSASAGGEHTQEELAAMLDALDPEDFRDHGAWLTLMQACHHATSGDGRQEFVEWSTRDPLYSDHAGVIGRRWDSLHAGDGGEARVTHRTLHKLLRDAGREDAVPRPAAEDDFGMVGPSDLPDGALPPDPAGEDHERMGPMERMNERYWAVMDGGQFKVFWEEEDPDTALWRLDPSTGEPALAVPARRRWVRARPYDFGKLLDNRRVRRGERTVPLAEAWLQWGGRRSARGVVFDPERDHEGFLNLWTGWGVEPRRGGSWGRLDELLHDVLSDGDDEVHGYALDWAAHMAQRPGRPAEVAVCFQGGKGVGKGTWGRALARLAGKHGMQVTSSEQLTGRFNDHLRDVVLLFADEALKPYDRDGESRLKGLITEPWLAYEGKGRDVVSGRNMLHIVMASNEEWFIPAGLDGERRFMMQRANSRRAGQHGWFQALHDELDAGGLQALMWDLLQRDVRGWSPRQGIPSTRALVEQKLRSMSPVEQWWFNALSEGEPPFPLTRDDMDWSAGPVRAFRQDVRESFDLHCRRNGVRHPGSMGRGVDVMFGRELRALAPGLGDAREPVGADRPDVAAHSDGRAWAYQLPSLADCRAAMEGLVGAGVDWRRGLRAP